MAETPTGSERATASETTRIAERAKTDETPIVEERAISTKTSRKRKRAKTRESPIKSKRLSKKDALWRS